MRLLTMEDILKAQDDAYHSFRRHSTGIRGQMITEMDSPEYHLAMAIEDAVIAKMKNQEPVAWRSWYPPSNNWTIWQQKPVQNAEPLFAYPVISELQERIIELERQLAELRKDV